MSVAPTIPTLVAGNRPGASYYAALAAYLEFQRNPPAAMAYRDTSRNVPNATDDLLVMDAESYDRNGIHSTVTNPSRMTIQTDGRYDVLARLTFASDSAGYRMFELRLNADGSSVGGTLLTRDTQSAVNGNVTTLELNFSRLFTTGDRIEGFGFQNSGSSLALDFGIRKCGIEVRWCGTT